VRGWSSGGLWRHPDFIDVGGVGAFAGAVLAGPLVRLAGTGPAMVASVVVGKATGLLVPLALNAGPLAVPLLVVNQLVGDALLSAYAIHALSLRQRVLPGAVLGRANAVFHAVSGVLLPAGALLAGALAEVAGMPAAVWVGAGGGLLAVPVLLRSPLARLR
jgi:hypothetical protein